MELKPDELENYLKLIFTGQKFVIVQDIDLVFKQPDNLIKMKADLVRKKSYDKAVDSGLLPLKDLEKLIDDRNLISPSEQNELKRLESRLEGQRAVLNKTKKVNSNIERLEGIVKELEDRINEIKYKKLSKLSLSADIKAEEDKYVFLCTNCVYDMLNDDLYWRDYTKYSNDANYNFKQEVLDLFVEFLRGIDTSIIRYIARNNLWRIRYITSMKTTESLFGVPTSDYTDDMVNLVFWSNYYNNIYEMMPEDKPPDQVIDDDDALDAYMAAYYDEKEKENLARKGDKQAKGKGRMSAFNNEEVIVTKSNELYEDLKYDKPREAQRVRDRNTVGKKKRRRRR